MATHRKSRTVTEIAEIFGIPIAVCYRRIKELEDIALLQKDEQILTQRGKRRWTYVSNIHNLELFYRDGRIIVRCELRNGFAEIYPEVLP